MLGLSATNLLFLVYCLMLLKGEKPAVTSVSCGITKHRSNRSYAPVVVTQHRNGCRLPPIHTSHHCWPLIFTSCCSLTGGWWAVLCSVLSSPALHLKVGCHVSLLWTASWVKRPSALITAGVCLELHCWELYIVCNYNSPIHSLKLQVCICACFLVMACFECS